MTHDVGYPTLRDVAEGKRIVKTRVAQIESK